MEEDGNWAWRGIYMDVPVPLADCTVLPTSCPRSTLSELFSKSHWSVPVFLKCVGHLFPAQDPSVTLSLPETAQDIKHELATAIQGFPLSFPLPKHIPDLQNLWLSSHSYSTKIQIRSHLVCEAFPGLLPGTSGFHLTVFK
ncbi:hypothetical protein D623_10030737 [Myotis brandtii]|uniref:Uncharacterized protein n=1 Tax=Myotis brandtii TaxID=109478 RepID=S7MT88_MYOBR|nr:hypothetical protein D623_10030737 [Myotis brandtii]